MIRCSIACLVFFTLLLSQGFVISAAPQEKTSVQRAEGDLYPEIEPYTTGFLKVNDLHTLYYEESGNPEGIPVMCLHGGPGSGCYPRMRRYFDPAVYRIVSHDQRGSARSRPLGELRGNFSEALVEDVERLRKHLKLGKVLLFGGSWGSTLSLLYAEHYPEQVTGMILRGVFLGTEEEVMHHYIGTKYFYPEEHAALLEILPDKSRDTNPDYLYELVRGKDKVLSKKILDRLGRFEMKFMKLYMDDAVIEKFLSSIPDDARYKMACLDLHYVTNRYFIEEGRILKDIDSIKHLPAIIIHGRYDMAASALSAYRLHKAMPESKLVIVEKAGHSESEEGITKELVKATAVMAK